MDACVFLRNTTEQLHHLVADEISKLDAIHPYPVVCLLALLVTTAAIFFVLYKYEILQKMRRRLYGFVRRLSLRWNGYRRPPFLLRFAKRKRLWLWVVEGNELGGWWFSVDGRRNPQNKSTTDSRDKYFPGDEWALFLYPDRLLKHYYIFAACSAIPFLSNLSGGMIMLFLIILILIAEGACFCVHSLLRLPILDGLQPKSQRLSSHLKAFLSYYLPDSADSDILKARLSRLFGKTLDTVYQYPGANIQKSLIKFAIAELFQKSGAPSDSTLMDRGFFRWLFYWCAPCWSSYLVLLLMLIPLAWGSGIQTDACDEHVLLLISLAQIPEVLKGVCDDNYKHRLVIAILVWLILSVRFIISEFTELKEYSQLTREDKRQLPSTLFSIISHPPAITQITDEKVKMVIAAVNTACAGIYLAALQNL